MLSLRLNSILRQRKKKMATPWKVPKTMWAGRTVIVLASGPSLTSCLPTIRLRLDDPLVATVAVNSTGIPTKDDYGRVVPAAAPWADMLYAADWGWWSTYQQEALSHTGIKVTASENCFPAVHYLHPTGPEGYDPSPGKIRTGGNSAYQALHIAAQAGASRILLCGVDLTNKNGRHHHGHHPSPLRNPGDDELIAMGRRFATIVKPMKELGIEVLNCSPDSMLECFPKVPIEEALS